MGGAGESNYARLARALLRAAGDPPLCVELWDGTRIGRSGPSGEAPAVVHVRNRRGLLAPVLRPHLGFGDAFVRGDIDVDGDLTAFFEALFASDTRAASPVRTAVHRLASYARQLRAPRHNVGHYELGERFYEAWLDPALSYTCAYFSSPTDTLEQAQNAKMRRVCEKLSLREGERVVEAGSGWGALAIFMAREYGVSVDAYNLSPVQTQYACARAQEQGVGDRVRFVCADYGRIRGSYDAFVSVGMLEHVGLGNMRRFGRVIRDCLSPDGRALVHSIGRARAMPTQPWIERRIFPGGYVPALSQMSAVFEPNDLTVHDIENLRLHYAQTTGRWLAGLEDAGTRLAAEFGEERIRAWRLYLAAAGAGFSTGWLQLFQVVVTRSAAAANPVAELDF